MTKIILILSFLFSLNLTAKEIEVLSFREVSPNSRMAELCVKVTADKLASIEILDITVDPGRAQARYTYILSPLGDGCTTFHTLTGRAEIGLRSSELKKNITYK